MPSVRDSRLGLLVNPDPADEPRPLPVPPAGPIWYPAVMGTGILANTLHQCAERLPGAAALAVVVLLISWALLIGLTAGYGLRLARDPGLLGRDLHSPFWGPVAMGAMSAGSAAATIVPAHLPGLSAAAWAVDGVLWVLATAIGLAAEWLHLLRRRRGTEPEPSFVSCLAVLAPMVSSTVGAGVAAHCPHILGGIVLAISAFSWIASLVLGWAIFIPAYRSTLRRAPLPLAASASAIILLGIVGQSVAGAVAIAAQSRAWLGDGAAKVLDAAANGWGWAMLVLGAPMIAWGLLVYARGLARSMPFTPGWFGATFPIGTLALGGILLGGSTGVAAVTWMGTAACVVLTATVSIGLAGAATALLREPA